VNKLGVIVVAVGCIGIGFFAGRVSVKSGASKAVAPLAPLKIDRQQDNSSVALGAAVASNITFEDAVINQRGPTPTNSFVSFTLRGKWTNKSSSPVTIFYDVHFYDESGVELYSDGRFTDVDANSASVAPQVVGTFQGKASDNFDYQKVKSVVVKFVAKGSNAEKVAVRNIPIRLIE
jgi:uncharacterized protein YcfL